MLSVTYKPFMLSVIMLSVVMLNVVMLSVVMLNVLTPFCKISVTATYFKLSFDKLRRSYLNVGHAFSQNGKRQRNKWNLQVLQNFQNFLFDLNLLFFVIVIVHNLRPFL
jgi:hypothetical protein